METTFYDEHSIHIGGDVSSLKQRLTLDLNNRPAKRLKVSHVVTPPVLSSPDLNMLKLGSPELEKFLAESPNIGPVLPTTTAQILFPKNVTEEQERYARGFFDALNELQHSDSSQGTVTNLQSEVSRTNSSSNTSGGSYVTLDTNYHSPFQFGSLSPSENTVVIKDELQTVPNMCSPPVSPIDMECQERIKLERKRQRNRVAASKCRRRKLEKIAQLEDKVKNLKGENMELTHVMNKLKEQVYRLKQQVMEHARSGCQIVMTSQPY